MNTRKSFLITYILSSLFAFTSFSQWVQTGGPGGGTINSLAVYGNDLFAGTERGLYFSTNHGSSWNRVNSLPASIKVFSLAVNYTNAGDTVLYAGTDSTKVLRSTDKGVSWVDISGTWAHYSSVGITALVIFSISGGSDTMIVAGSYQGYIYYSTDDGVSWTTLKLGVNRTDQVSCLFRNGAYLFACASDGVYRSADDGVNWSKFSNGLSSNAPVKSMVSMGTYLFIAVENYNGSPLKGVYRSADNGANWVVSSNGLPGYAAYSLLLSGTNLYTSTAQGIYLSTDSGANWTYTGSGVPPYRTICFAKSLDEIYLFAGTQYSGVYSSTNNGVTWSEASIGMPNSYVKNVVTKGAYIFAATNYAGVFRSSDQCASWSSVNNGLTSTSINNIAVCNGNILVSTKDGVFLSTNDGASWADVNNGLPNKNTYRFATKRTCIFASNSAGVFLTTDNGLSWSSKNNGLPTYSKSAIIVADSNVFVVSNGNSVYRSSNDGDNWIAVNSGLPAYSSEVWDFAFNGQYLFVGLYREGVYRSSDYGSNWTAANSGLGTTLTSLTSGGTCIFATTTNYGFYTSTNNGTSWTSINTGLISQYSLSQLRTCRADLFGGTYDYGIWKRPMSDFTTTSPSLIVNPNILNFGYVTYSRGATQSIIVTNTGTTGPLSITSVTSVADMTIVPNPSVAYPITLEAGESYHFDVTFTPTTLNPAIGNIVFQHDAGSGTTNLHIYGQGKTTFSLDSSSLNFGAVVIEKDSIRTITVTNLSAEESFSITGATASAFYSITPNPPAAYPITLSSGASQNFDVTFSPASIGQIQGNVVFIYDAIGGTTTLPVNGFGAYAPNIVLSTGTLNFTDAPIGRSATQSMTVTNNSVPSTLVITGATATAGYSIVTNPAAPYPISVAGGASRTFDVTFTPTSDVPVAGTITFAHNAAGGTTDLAVSGNGQYILTGDGFGGNATGGAGGATVTASNLFQFTTYATSALPYIINVSGTIVLGGSLNIESNKTIQGVDENATISGNLYIGSGVRNVILQNLNFTNPYGMGTEGDGVTIIGAKAININHCTFTDCADGSCDITVQADSVTLAWCRFRYVNRTTHRYVNLIGDNDSRTTDLGTLHVTIHHCWYDQNCNERMPSVRFGRVHVYNNYFSSDSALYCVRTRLSAECLVEGNYFERVKNPWELALSKASGTVTGKLRAVNNNISYLDTTNGIRWIDGWYEDANIISKLIPGTDTVFNVPYVYTLDNAQEVKNKVLLNYATYTITATVDGNGTITPIGVTSVHRGSSKDYIITPDTGYHVSDVLVDGSSVGTVGSYTFTNVTENHTIHASFAVNTYTITATAGEHGSITPSGVTILNYGSTQSYTMKPDSGYYVANVIVDDVSVGEGTSYHFTHVTSNHTISVSFTDTLPTTKIAMSSGWNLVSVPRVQANDSAEVIFPGKYGSLFGYNQTIGDYVEAPTLDVGMGYWVYYTEADTLVMNGAVADTVKITCKVGWHLIGSREREVPVANLELSVGSIYGSAFYYDTSLGDYAETAVIQPGQGIWVYVTEDCELTIP